MTQYGEKVCLVFIEDMHIQGQFFIMIQFKVRFITKKLCS